METVNIKEEARRLIDQLPENSTWDDLMYLIYVRQAVEAGLADSQAGRIIAVEEVMKAIRQTIEGNSQLTKKSNFWEAMQKFRQEENIALEGIEPEVFEGVRDKSSGRLEVSILSESSLEKDWFKPEEDEAW